MGDTAKAIAPTAGNASEQTLFTVNAATGAIGYLKHLHIANTTAGALTFKMSIGADAAGTRLYSDTSIPGNGGFLDWPCWMPIAASGTLRWTAPTGLTVSGGWIESIP